MAKRDYESSRTATSVVALFALIGCLFGSWLAFAVLCTCVIDYQGTAFCELLAKKWGVE